MTYEFRVARGQLSTNWSSIFGVDLFPILQISSELTQFAVVTELKISVSLPSKPLYEYVADSSLDAAIQEQQELDAWNQVIGNSIEVKYSDAFSDPLKYKINNVAGGYAINLITRLSLAPVDRQVVLNPSEILQLKLTESLGSGDKISYEATGYVWVNDSSIQV
jgi:hypothetical protein